MVSPSEKLAQSLEKLRKIQNNKGIAGLKATDMSRTHRDRLVSNASLENQLLS